MEKTLAVINYLKEQGIIRDFAVCRGMAAMFYMEPVLTYDLDVFCVFGEEPKRLDILSPLYKWANRAGYKTFKEHLMIEGLPVQFIPVYNDLIRESVETAVKKKVGLVKTRVVAPEYLVAIMLQTYRKKDLINAGKMMNEAKLNTRLLSGILKKHGLQAKFNAIRGL
ncbi:MAG: hypothetical protein KKH28_02165 [Elusimicrobia bacterium]|nr:hypothetical protein [Elusimicrobiota bacterium]